METIGVIVGTTEIAWKSILIVLAVLAWFFISYALYAAHGGGRLCMWLFLLPSVALSALLSRLLYWYCNQEQYASFAAALTEISPEGFAMAGILPGIFIIAGVLRLLRISKSLRGMLDALAPGTALGMGLLYLTCLFDARCRGKVIVTAQVFQHLPFSAPMAVPQGGVEYRFAVFFVSFLAMLCIAKLCMDFYLARWQERGCTAALFLMLYAAAGYILDSCRYDAGYFPFNGFVSVLQIFAAFAFLGLAVAFSVRMIRRRSFRWYMVPLWFALLGAMGAAGTLEYLVQRYGDRFLLWYGLMGISCLAIVLLLYLMYALGRPAGAQPEKAEKPAGISPDITDAAAKKPSGPAETEEKNPLALPAGLAAFSAVLAALGLGALLVSKKDRE